MTDNEIIKANELCAKTPMACEECPYYCRANCVNSMTGDTIDLINRQKAEIETLKAHEEKEHQYCKNKCEPKYKAEIERLKNNQVVHIDINEQFRKECEHEVKTAKAEAFKELSEKIKEEIRLILKDAYDERRTRIRHLEDNCRYVVLDVVVQYYEGKIHSLDRVYRFIDNFLKEMVGED